MLLDLKEDSTKTKYHKDSKVTEKTTNIYNIIFKTKVMYISVRRTRIIPSVLASDHPSADNDVPPERPPKMKYKDLSVYNSPHSKYKDYLDDKYKCSDDKVVTINDKIGSVVKTCREVIEDISSKVKPIIQQVCVEVPNGINDRKNAIKAYMRDDERLAFRKAFVVAGTTTGFLLGSCILRRQICFAGLACLTTGFLAFPKETDESIRNFSYFLYVNALSMVNWWFETNYKIPTRYCEMKLEKPEPRPVYEGCLFGEVEPCKHHNKDQSDNKED